MADTTDNQFGITEGGVRRFFTNCWAGLGLMGLQPVKAEDFRFSVDQAVLFVLLSYLIGTITRTWFGQSLGVIWTEVGRDVAMEHLLGLAGLFLVAKIHRSVKLFPALIVGVGFGLIITNILFQLELPLKRSLANPFVGRQIAEFVTVFAVIWLIIVVVRAIRIVFETTMVNAFGYFTLIAAIFGFASVLFNLESLDAWWQREIVGTVYQRGPQSAKFRKPINFEQVYYSQRPMLKRQLGSITSSDPAKSEYYFVGIAGDATRDLFRDEVIQARQLMDDRFATKGRSITLINNRDSLEQTPLANFHNLSISLRRIAGQMDRDDDILVLYLSSLRSTSGRLSVKFPGFKFNAINAIDIRRLLDKLKIKWRVIVVSTCHAGNMFNPLASENTLIISAARPGLTSFGCAGPSAKNYFAEAFLSQALLEEPDFARAFNKAKAIVGAREKSEELILSEPQMSFGAAINEKLDQMARQ